MGLVVLIELVGLELAGLIDLVGLTDLVDFVVATGLELVDFAVDIESASAVAVDIESASAVAVAFHFQQRLRKNCRTYRQRQSYFRNLCKTSQPSLIRAAISFTEKSAFYTTTTCAIFARERNLLEL